MKNYKVKWIELGATLQKAISEQEHAAQLEKLQSQLLIYKDVNEKLMSELSVRSQPQLEPTEQDKLSAIEVAIQIAKLGNAEFWSEMIKSGNALVLAKDLGGKWKLGDNEKS